MVKDDSVLLFGCENHILREEWIGAFVEVMNAFSKIISTPHLITSSTLESQHVVLERKGSLNGKNPPAVYSRVFFSFTDDIIIIFYVFFVKQPFLSEFFPLNLDEMDNRWLNR